MAGNLIVMHGGGPTAVINASLYGVIREAQASPEVERVYAAIGGTGGFLKEQLRDVTDLTEQQRHDYMDDVADRGNLVLRDDHENRLVFSARRIHQQPQRAEEAQLVMSLQFLRHTLAVQNGSAGDIIFAELCQQLIKTFDLIQNDN